MSCTRAQEFLEKKKIEAKTITDARKESFGKKEALALALAGDVQEIYVAKGSKVVHFDLRIETPDKDELASLLLGPTGNLRAPAIKTGGKLIVGFNEDAYAQVMK